MKCACGIVDIKTDGTLYLKDIDISRVLIPFAAAISIDGSTDTTGISILRKRDAAMMYSIAVSREKSQGETPVQYKVRLKRVMYDLLIRNRLIDRTYYEEPFIGYATAAPNLFMLRTFIEEIMVENDPYFQYLTHSEINNKHWKKLFLAPAKCPNGTDLEKAAVRAKVVQFMPFMSERTQDEIDAYAMGFVAITETLNGNEDGLASKKKAKPFKYEIRFIGANDDESMTEQLHDVYDGPERLTEEGMSFAEIKGTANFDKTVYEMMGNDDKVLIIKFKSKHHGNLILQYRIGDLANNFDYIYALVWRQYRKTN